MSSRIILALLFVTSAFALKCWNGTGTTTDSSVFRNVTILNCTGNNDASYCSIGLNTANATTEQTFECNSNKTCKSEGWNSESLYCCGTDLCNDNTNKAAGKSLQMFTAGSVLLMLAFQYSQ